MVFMNLRDIDLKISFRYQVKNEQIDGIMIVDSHDYGGQYEQKAISTWVQF